MKPNKYLIGYHQKTFGGSKEMCRVNDNLELVNGCLIIQISLPGQKGT
jgi:hypothetical protein